MQHKAGTVLAGQVQGAWAAQSQISVPGHRSLELQESWEADCPLDLGLQTAAPGSCQAAASAAGVFVLLTDVLFLCCPACAGSSGITVSLELSAWGVLGVGSGPEGV